MVVDHYTVHTLSKQALQYTVSHLLHRLVAAPLQHSSHFTPESKTKMTQLKGTVEKDFCDMLSYTQHFFETSPETPKEPALTLVTVAVVKGSFMVLWIPLV